MRRLLHRRPGRAGELDLRQASLKRVEAFGKCRQTLVQFENFDGELVERVLGEPGVLFEAL